MSPRPKNGRASTPVNTRSRSNNQRTPSTRSSSVSSPETSTCSSTPNENADETPASRAKPSTSRAGGNPSFSKVTKNKTTSRTSTKTSPLSKITATRSGSTGAFPSNAQAIVSSSNDDGVSSTSNVQAILSTSYAHAAPSTSYALAAPSTSCFQAIPSTSYAQANPSESTSYVCPRSPPSLQLANSSIYKIISKICNEDNPAQVITHAFLHSILDEMYVLVGLEHSPKMLNLMNQIANDLAEYIAQGENTEEGKIAGDPMPHADCIETNYHLNLTLMELRNIDNTIYELNSKKIGIYNKFDASLYHRPRNRPDVPFVAEEMEMEVRGADQGPSGMPVMQIPPNYHFDQMQVPMVPIPPPQPMSMIPPPMQMMSPPLVRMPAPIPVPPPPPVPVPPPPPPPVPPPPPLNSNQYFDNHVVNAAARSCFVVPVKEEINIIQGNPEEITVSKITDIRSHNLTTLKDSVICSSRSGKIYRFPSKKNYMAELPTKLNTFHVCSGPVAAMVEWNNSLIIATVSGTIKKCSMVRSMGCKIQKTLEVGMEVVCMTEIQGVLYVSTRPGNLHIINLRSLTRLKDTVETGHLIKVLKNTFYNEEEILICLNENGEITGSAIHEGVIGSVVFKFTLPGVAMMDVYIQRPGPSRVTFMCGSRLNASCLHLEHGVFSQGRMLKLASSAMVTYEHLNFLGTRSGDIMIANITTMQTYVYSNVVKESINSLLYVPKFLYISTTSGLYCLHLKNHNNFLKAEPIR